MSIRCVIAEDEALALQKLKMFLSAEPDIHVVAECRDANETVDALNTYRPDLLFLDIQMPGDDGFEVLKQVTPDYLPLVIFTTAFDNYAVKAFEMHALDYLLKPFDRERLHTALERARKQLLSTGSEAVTHRMLDFLATAQTTQKAKHRFVIRSGGRVVFLELTDIHWIEAAANYVRVHTASEAYMVRGTIGEIANKLDPSKFIRIHRSIIVNVDNIKELQPCNSGEYMVVLRNGKELPGSRGFRPELERVVRDFGVS